MSRGAYRYVESTRLSGPTQYGESTSYNDSSHFNGDITRHGALPTLLLKGHLRAHSGQSQTELDEWKPLDYIINWFTQRSGTVGIKNHVLILKSETASGKSTALPPEMYRKLVRGGTTNSRGIICTQPRVATAIENVVEMMKYHSTSLRLGETIGWSTKHNKFRPTNVGLLSATVGTLAQMLRTLTDDEIMTKYRYIMIDETHERDLQTDMTIAALKGLLTRQASNPECPFVVLMSATFEPDSLLKYFGVTAVTSFIWCCGKTAHIEEMWEWNQGRIVNDYPRAASTVVEQILRDGVNDAPGQADVLIFMPGKAEFTETATRLDRLNAAEAAAGRPVFSLLQVDGPAFQTQNRDFMLTVRVPISDHEVIIDGKKLRPARRVIISTNVAETGLTLENLKYVIDSGYNREIEFNPVLKIRALVTKPVPIQRVQQRRGRCGRKFPGVFYPLYPKYIYDRLPTSQFPQILTEDVSMIYLNIMAEQLRGGKPFNPYAIDMVDPPGPDATKAVMSKLHGLGFVALGATWDEEIAANPIAMLVRGVPVVSIGSGATEHTSIGITPLGYIARAFNDIPLECIRMILSSYYWGANTLDVIGMAAYLVLEPKSLVGSRKTKAGGDMKATIDWAAVYRTGLPAWSDSGRGSVSTLYKMRLLVADEFIQGVILFDAIKATLASGPLKFSLASLRKWCDGCGLSYRGCLDLIRTRDDIINQMIAIGLRIFGDATPLSTCTQNDFTNTIARLKYCIYDGYRANILTLSDGSTYMAGGTAVITPKLFRDDEKTRSQEFAWAADAAKPHRCVYRALSLKYNRATFAFDVKADDISVMDGWVSIDAERRPN